MLSSYFYPDTLVILYPHSLIIILPTSLQGGWMVRRIVQPLRNAGQVLVY